MAKSYKTISGEKVPRCCENCIWYKNSIQPQAGVKKPCSEEYWFDRVQGPTPQKIFRCANFVSTEEQKIIDTLKNSNLEFLQCLKTLSPIITSIRETTSNEVVKKVVSLVLSCREKELEIMDEWINDFIKSKAEKITHKGSKIEKNTFWHVIMPDGKTITARLVRTDSKKRMVTFDLGYPDCTKYGDKRSLSVKIFEEKCSPVITKVETEEE